MIHSIYLILHRMGELVAMLVEQGAALREQHRMVDVPDVMLRYNWILLPACTGRTTGQRLHMVTHHFLDSSNAACLIGFMTHVTLPAVGPGCRLAQQMHTDPLPLWVAVCTPAEPACRHWQHHAA